MARGWKREGSIGPDTHPPIPTPTLTLAPNTLILFNMVLIGDLEDIAHEVWATL